MDELIDVYAYRYRYLPRHCVRVYPHVCRPRSCFSLDFTSLVTLRCARPSLTSARGVRERSAALQLATILILYTSTAVFAGAVLGALFEIVNLTEAAANAIVNCDIGFMSYSAIDSVYMFGNRMNCIQTSTLVVNVCLLGLLPSVIFSEMVLMHALRRSSSEMPSCGGGSICFGPE